MDPVDEAIAAAAAQPRTFQMQQHSVTIASTGRPFVMAVPVDVTEAELLEIVGWVGRDLRLALQQRQRTTRPRIVIPA